MSTSIKVLLDVRPNANGLHLIRLQVIHDRIKVYLNTGIRVRQSEFSGEQVTKNESKDKYNLLLKKQKRGIDDRITDARLKDIKITKEILEGLVKGVSTDESAPVKLVDFFDDREAWEMSEGRRSRYKVVQGKIKDFDDKVLVNKIDYSWLLQFEAHLRKTGIGNNTLKSNMSVLRAVMHRAMKRDLIDKNPFVKYTMPKIAPTEAVYLTEIEVAAFQKVVEAIVGRPSKQGAGFRYLFSCCFGYRISDNFAFDPAENIVNGNMILRARKNGRMINIPISPKHQPILDYILAHPETISQQKTRDYVKEIALDAGIKKDVKFHSSRHTFASMLLNRGVAPHIVSELLGDTIDVTKIYLHLADETVHREYKDKMWS